MKSKNKILLILIIVFSTICIAFATTLIVSSIQLAYAEEHYEVTYTDFSLSKLATKTPYGYGCGDSDCKYCNGRKSVKNGFDNFVYYKTHKSLKTASIVILCVSGGLLATCLLCFAIPKKEQ